jgi:hypothetical protein
MTIGNATKNAVAFQNYSSSCGFCECHSKKMEKLKSPVLPVPDHQCPKNHTGSSKGMEAKADFDCVNKGWSYERHCGIC